MSILSHAIALAQQTGNVFTDTLAFENGSIANNVYSNECLGLSFVIPEGWRLRTHVVGTDVIATHSSIVSLVLLTIEQQPGGLFTNMMALNAHDATAFEPTLQQFVANSAHRQINLDPRNRKMVKDAYAVNYGGKYFFRADYRQTVSGGTLYAAMVFTKFRGYYIGETVMAKSPEELNLAASSLQQITFRNDQPNLKCVMNGEDNLDSGGITRGVRTSRPSLYRGPNSAPLPVLVSQGVSKGLVTKKVPPQYPETALQGQVQGQVVLSAVIDKKGDVEELTLVSGHPILAPAALEAVKQWKYEPYLLNGQPVKIETQITVVFQLDGQ